MTRMDSKQTENSEYGQKMKDLADTIAKVMNDVGQGYAFSVLPQIDDERAHFSAFGMPEKDGYISFWAGIAALIHDARACIPENDQSDFKEGFIAMVKLVGNTSFPLLDTERLLEDAEKGE